MDITRPPLVTSGPGHVSTLRRMTTTGPSTGAENGPRTAITRAPKAVLHDHLDGGLRPSTIVELSAEIGHRLPAPDSEALARWFRAAAHSGSLERYLET